MAYIENISENEFKAKGPIIINIGKNIKEFLKYINFIIDFRYHYFNLILIAK